MRARKYAILLAVAASVVASGSLLYSRVVVENTSEVVEVLSATRSAGLIEVRAVNNSDEPVSVIYDDPDQWAELYDMLRPHEAKNIRLDASDHIKLDTELAKDGLVDGDLGEISFSRF